MADTDRLDPLVAHPGTIVVTPHPDDWVDPAVLVEELKGPRRLLLGGRSWQVTYIDWTRRRCFVEPSDGGGRAHWTGTGVAGLSFALSRAMRDVLLGTDPPVRLTRRAVDRLAEIRDQDGGLVRPNGTVVVRSGSGFGDGDGQVRQVEGSDCYGCRACCGPRVGQDVEAVGGIVGQVGQVGIGHFEDVDLNRASRCRHQNSRGAARLGAAGQQELQLRGFADVSAVHRIQIAGRPVRPCQPAHDGETTDDDDVTAGPFGDGWNGEN